MGNRIEVDNDGNVTCIIEDVAVQLETEALIAENADLRREIALNEPLFEALNAANDALLAENAELRKMLDLVPNCDACEAMQDCWECLRADTSHHERKRLSVENAELRKLVRELYEDQCDECDEWKYRDRMHELGVDA